MAKALSVQQPYAELIVSGKKTIETRSWGTKYRGLIYIHASTKYLNGGDLTPERVRIITGKEKAQLDYGCIVGTAWLDDCVEMDEEFIESMKHNNQREYEAGFYSPHRYAWRLINATRLAKPIPVRGNLGLWNWNEGVMK